MTGESFETRLRRFYDSCTPEEQQVVAVMCGLFVAAGQADAGEVAGYMRLGSSSALQSRLQQEQDQQQPYSRKLRILSNLHKKYSDTMGSIVQNMK